MSGDPRILVRRETDTALRESLTEAIFVVNALLFASGVSDAAKGQLIAYRNKWEAARQRCHGGSPEERKP